MDNLRALSKEEFLECYLFYEDLRHPHRRVFTKDNKLEVVKDIVEYLQQPGIMEEIDNNIKESNMTEIFTEPVNLDDRFWTTGNNLFYNCVRAGFRKNVLCYKDANEYIASYIKNNRKDPMLFSMGYYNSLKKMSDKEIKVFLKQNPLGLREKIIEHGMHRTCAMIGRLVRNEKYIPIFVEKSEG